MIPVEPCIGRIHSPLADTAFHEETAIPLRYGAYLRYTKGTASTLPCQCPAAALQSHRQLVRRAKN